MSTAEYMRQRYEERKRLGYQLLGGTCVVCGTRESLEFDHIDPATKVLAVSQMMKARMDLFLAEVAKCQLLCTEHHGDKTASERIPWRHGTLHGYMNKDCRCEPCKEVYGFWRRKGRPKPQPAPHGTRARYLRKCRCEDCTVANRVYTRDLYARKRVGGVTGSTRA